MVSKMFKPTESNGINYAENYQKFYLIIYIGKRLWKKHY